MLSASLEDLFRFGVWHSARLSKSRRHSRNCTAQQKRTTTTTTTKCICNICVRINLQTAGCIRLPRVRRVQFAGRQNQREYCLLNRHALPLSPFLFGCCTLLLDTFHSCLRSGIACQCVSGVSVYMFLPWKLIKLLIYLCPRRGLSNIAQCSQTAEHAYFVFIAQCQLFLLLSYVVIEAEPPWHHQQRQLKPVLYWELRIEVFFDYLAQFRVCFIDNWRIKYFLFKTV